MSLFKVLLKYADGYEDEDDETFETESEASEHGCYLCSCAREGAEILHMSNPGDYPDDDCDVDFEIIEVDD